MEYRCNEISVAFLCTVIDLKEYLEHNCRKDNVIENQIFSYPIKVLTAYPVVSKNNYS